MRDTGLDAGQRRFVADLIERYTRRTRGSKEMTQASRAVLADPRVAAGFDPEWKEIVYPIVTVRSEGSKLWDVDGNTYIDLLNGFGQTAFGHAPDFVREAPSRKSTRALNWARKRHLAARSRSFFAISRATSG